MLSKGLMKLYIMVPIIIGIQNINILKIPHLIKIQS